MFKIIFLLALARAISGDATTPQTFAVLVAGSNQYYNYRHQADICHAYQVLHNHGVPDSNIIVFMYDDIANNIQNPTKGIIINHPDGDDVYHGVPKDYTGNDVTPENFMNVLTGNANAVQGIGSGRVLKSGPNDHVFINFVDHGATGLLAFPNDIITVQQLQQTLETMNNQNQYSKLVFYLEACEAGSMFNSWLPNNISIFATTASNPTESSYACYYDEQRETYLGDLYSVNWMEDSDAENLAVETLQTQFTIDKNLTNLSHVTEYGDLTISSLVVGAFQGEQSSKPIRSKSQVPKATSPSYDVPVDVLFQRLSRTQDEKKRSEIKEQINTLLSKRSSFEKTFNTIIRKAAKSEEQLKNWFQTRPSKLTKLDCHHQLVHSFNKNCYNFAKNPYTMTFAYVLANMCEDGVNAKVATTLFENECKGFNVIRENVIGENVIGENVIGRKFNRQNVIGENVIGENVIGQKFSGIL